MRTGADVDRDPRGLVGRDDVELHFERFAAPPVVDGREFSVSIASTGQEVAVGADETLLAALRRVERRGALLMPARLLRHVPDAGGLPAPSTIATRC